MRRQNQTRTTKMKNQIVNTVTQDRVKSHTATQDNLQDNNNNTRVKDNNRPIRDSSNQDKIPSSHILRRIIDIILAQEDNTNPKTKDQEPPRIVVTEVNEPPLNQEDQPQPRSQAPQRRRQILQQRNRPIKRSHHHPLLQAQERISINKHHKTPFRDSSYLENHKIRSHI